MPLNFTSFKHPEYIATQQNYSNQICQSKPQFFLGVTSFLLVPLCLVLGFFLSQKFRVQRYPNTLHHQREILEKMWQINSSK
ncbi:hypothetical protein Ple7327_3460 [Pleurocapsa sp. PCC 7327]|nr:hypothetical protein Ple7327_3460 [Pleurocapsa sp. PCC 7327]